VTSRVVSRCVRWCPCGLDGMWCAANCGVNPRAATLMLRPKRLVNQASWLADQHKLRSSGEQIVSRVLPHAPLPHKCPEATPSLVAIGILGHNGVSSHVFPVGACCLAILLAATLTAHTPAHTCCSGGKVYLFSLYLFFIIIEVRNDGWERGKGGLCHKKHTRWRSGTTLLL
jgi:hypothetical protein